MVAAVAAGCTGAASRSIPPAAPSQTSYATTGSARFTIAVPTRAGAASVRRPQYIGPSTQSMRITITGPSNSTQIVNLTPTSSGCASTLATTQCTLVLALSPGSYTANITTYDGANATGTMLSLAQTVNFTIVAGTTNTIALTLSGVPHSIGVTSASAAVSGSAAAGFLLKGTLAQTLTAEAFDADGNLIVGPGAPTYTVSLLSGSGFATANPSATTPNSFSVTPPGVEGAGAWIKVTASSGNNACGQVGASCTTAFLIRNHLQPLYVANLGNTITVYHAPYTGAPSTISNGVNAPNALALNANGDLFATADIEMEEFVPPYTGSPTLVGNSLSVDIPLTIGVDEAGDLFVANDGNSTVSMFAPPYTGTPTTISNNIATPAGFVVDPAGDFFVSNAGGNVLEFIPPYTSLPSVITNGVSGPGALALDPAGMLFIANTGNNTVTYYRPSYNGSPITISNGISGPDAFAFDAADDLFVANRGNNTVTVYTPPYVSAPTRISTGINGPSALAVDATGTLFVVNGGNGTVMAFAPPYTGAPTPITLGITGPSALLVGP